VDNFKDGSAELHECSETSIQTLASYLGNE